MNQNGAVEHVADRVDLPGLLVTDCEGSNRRQMLLAADGKELSNEGEARTTTKGEEP